MPDKMTFEKKLERLEMIVNDIESTKKPLADIISLFKEGVALSEECKKDLYGFEAEIKKVTVDTSKKLEISEEND